MIYENPTIVKSWDSIDEPPFMVHMEDQDGEVLELEYNLDGLVIVRVHQKGHSSPCVPAVKLINALLELNEQGMKSQKFDGFDAS